MAVATPSGVLCIKKLNEEVDRKTQEAVEEAKRANKPLDLAYEAVRKPMSAGGIWAGSPIYVRRPIWPCYVLAANGVYLTCNGFWNVGPWQSLVCAVVMFLWYDLFSGILHVVLDEPKNIELPLIGQPALEFQWHHFVPRDIVRKDFTDVVGDLNLVGLILCGFHFVYSTSFGTDHVAASLGGMKLWMAWYGQYSHRCAHNPKIAENPIGKFLQTCGLMISVKDHKQHHQAPYDEDFCLIGVCNPVIDGMRKVVVNRHAWLVFFLFTALFDIALLAAALKLVM